jgi:hypothetical protein
MSSSSKGTLSSVEMVTDRSKRRRLDHKSTTPLLVTQQANEVVREEEDHWGIEREDDGPFRKAEAECDLGSRPGRRN